MPGFTTHYILGMKAFNDLPSNPLKHIISKYRWLYQLGLQGPDMFFYNIPILRHRDYRNVGSYMHEHHVNLFFDVYLKQIAQIHSKQQREQAGDIIGEVHKEEGDKPPYLSFQYSLAAKAEPIGDWYAPEGLQHGKNQGRR